MAAGRVSPFVGLTFAWHTIRPCDMVAVGCLTPEEADDIDIPGGPGRTSSRLEGGKNRNNEVINLLFSNRAGYTKSLPGLFMPCFQLVHTSMYMYNRKRDY